MRGSSWYAGSEVSETPGRRIDALDATSYSLHEQPTLLSYLSSAGARGNVRSPARCVGLSSRQVVRAHETLGARYTKGGRKAPEEKPPPKIQRDDDLPEVKLIGSVGTGGWGAPTARGVQRGAGEKGFFREKGTKTHSRQW